MVLRYAFSLVLSSMVVFMVATYFLALVLGMALIFFAPGGVAVSQGFLDKAPLVLFMLFPFNLRLGTSLGVLFTFLLLIYLMCLLAAWLGPVKSFPSAVRDGFHDPIGRLFGNCLYSTPLIASMLFLAAFAIQSFQDGLGIPTGHISFSDPFKGLIDLAYASVAEEIGYRISPIGVLLLAYVFWIGRTRVAEMPWHDRVKLVFLAFLFPSGAKDLLGLKTVSKSGIRNGVSTPEWAMLVVTSLQFGLAHFLSGTGWKLGKIASASFLGFGMGLSYLIYGAHAPVLIHLFFNYYLTAYNIAAETYPIGLQYVNQAIDVVIFALGTIGWLISILLCAGKELLRAMRNRYLA